MVADAINFEIPRGEHVVIVGNNGQGKTTLLKTLAGDLAPVDGKVAWWHRANIGYYAQHVEAALNPREHVIDYLRKNANAFDKEEDLLRMAGNFCSDVTTWRSRSACCRAEKARLCLAGILLHDFNVLLLDEPTNHLDVETSESLAAALQEYEGTVLFVSHDRTFVNIVATRIIEVQNGTARIYPDTYEEYVATLEEILDADVREEADVAAPNADEETRQRRRLALREKQRDAQKLEKRVADLEKKKSELLQYFFDNPTDYAPTKNQELKEVTAQLIKDEDALLAALGEIDALR